MKTIMTILVLVLISALAPSLGRAELSVEDRNFATALEARLETLELERQTCGRGLSAAVQRISRLPRSVRPVDDREVRAERDGLLRGKGVYPAVVRHAHERYGVSLAAFDGEMLVGEDLGRAGITEARAALQRSTSSARSAGVMSPVVKRRRRARGSARAWPRARADGPAFTW